MLGQGNRVGWCRYNVENQNTECKDFTFFHFRSVKTCFLLRGCTDKRPKCTEEESCVSGKAEGRRIF